MKVIQQDGIANYKSIIALSWCPDIEESAMEQIKNLSRLPFAFKHLAIMPDCHAGVGMPIGTVLATHGAVIPNAVGIDIGCGMAALKTRIKASDISREMLEEIKEKIKAKVPTGFKKHAYKMDNYWMPDYNVNTIESPILARESENAQYQVGTLGGGNHFIEIQKDNEDNVWIMLHSGSRHLGKAVCEYYNQIAVEKNNKWFSSVPEEWGLAFLSLNTEDGINYLEDMRFCVEYAQKNRRLMMLNIGDVFRSMFGTPFLSTNELCIGILDVAHNYAQMENHFGHNVLVHRKGATSARSEQLGIIPGSQGTKSYIVRGRGDTFSFSSCSHGAGRTMSRSKARKVLNLAEQQDIMDSQGIAHDMTSVDNLDEAPGAYKKIDEVMQNQKDLVEIMVELTPIASIKETKERI